MNAVHSGSAAPLQKDGPRWGLLGQQFVVAVSPSADKRGCIDETGIRRLHKYATDEAVTIATGS